MHPGLQKFYEDWRELVARQLPESELPDVATVFGGIAALAQARMARPASSGIAAVLAAKALPEAEWITAEAAAEIASVPVKRIYEWGRNQKWASRPTKRCLRIDERGFRDWLRRRTS